MVEWLCYFAQFETKKNIFFYFLNFFLISVFKLDHLRNNLLKKTLITTTTTTIINSYIYIWYYNII